MVKRSTREYQLTPRYQAGPVYQAAPVYQPMPEYRPAREHRGARTLAGLLVTLLVLGGLAIGADRVAAWLVQGSIEQALMLGAATTPGARIDGADLQIGNDFPFLPHLMRGQLGHVSGSLERGVFGQLEVQDLHFVAEGVSIPSLTMADLGRRIAGRPGNVALPVEHLEANALIPYQTINTVIGQQLSYIAPDTIEVTTDGTSLIITIDLLGAEFAFATSPTVLPPSTIKVNVDHFTLGGVEINPANLPFGIGAQIPTEFEFDLDLPPGASIEQIQVQPNGLRIYLTAQNMDIARLTG